MTTLPPAPDRAPIALAVTASKAYGDCHALQNGALTVRAGDIAALVGENGAGKSTLCHIAAGTLRADGGEVSVFGARYQAAAYGAAAAQRHGVQIVTQHGSLIPSLSLIEHAMLTPRAGDASGKPYASNIGPAAKRRIGAELVAIIETTKLACDVTAATSHLSLAARQRAEIILALWRGAKLLILDEPTALLAPQETQALFTQLRAMAAATTIVIVTHRLTEVADLANEVTVLRRGQTVATFSGREVTDTARISAAMMGTFVAATPPPRSALHEPALHIKGLAIGPWHGHSPNHEGLELVLGRGEVVGIAGVDGNGQQELMATLAGTLPMRWGRHAQSPQCTLHPTAKQAVAVAALSARQRRNAGLVVTSADRHRDGIIESWSLPANALVARHDLFSSIRIPTAAADSEATRIVADMDVVPKHAATIGALSGGNQQKFYMGRELAVPGLVAMVCSQPTRGVDLRAAAIIWQRLYALATAGAAIAVLSADVDELLAHCHRVVVLDRGRILHAANATKQTLGELMTTHRGGAA